MMTTDKDLAVAREMLDAEIAAMAKTLAERDALCEQQTRTIHGIPALMRERDAEKTRADAAESREHALGVQVVALRERVRLLEPTVPALRHALATFEAYAAGHRERGDMTKAMRNAAEADSIRDALLPLDAVPGDALATCKPGLQVGVEASGVDVERLSVPAYDGEDEVTP